MVRGRKGVLWELVPQINQAVWKRAAEVVRAGAGGSVQKLVLVAVLHAVQGLAPQVTAAGFRPGRKCSKRGGPWT